MKTDTVAFIIAVLLIFAGVAGVAYAGLRGFGCTHWQALVVGYASLPVTYAVLLFLLTTPELATGLGFLCGALGLSGCAWWLWQRRPRVAADAAAHETAPATQVEDERTARLRAGMGSNVEWTVEEL